MFTEIEIIIVNSEQENKQVNVRFDKKDVSYYYPGFYQGTIIVMKSGQSFLATDVVGTIDQIMKQ